MDELELRLAALELWAIEVGAWMEPATLDDAKQAISSGLGRGCADEDMVRMGAIGLIEDARKRFRPDFPAGGLPAYAKMPIRWPRDVLVWTASHPNGLMAL